MKLFSEHKVFSVSFTLHSSFLHLGQKVQGAVRRGSQLSAQGRLCLEKDFGAGAAASAARRANSSHRFVLLVYPDRSPRRSSHATACLGSGVCWLEGGFSSWARLSGGLRFDLGCGNPVAYLPSGSSVCSPLLCSSKLSGGYGMS